MGLDAEEERSAGRGDVRGRLSATVALGRKAKVALWRARGAGWEDAAASLQAAFFKTTK